MGRVANGEIADKAAVIAIQLFNPLALEGYVGIIIRGEKVGRTKMCVAVCFARINAVGADLDVNGGGG